jgi:hypothetical protein
MHRRKCAACARLQLVAELTVKVKVCDFEQDQRRCNQGSKYPYCQHEHDVVLDHLCPYLGSACLGEYRKVLTIQHRCLFCFTEKSGAWIWLEGHNQTKKQISPEMV